MELPSSIAEAKTSNSYPMAPNHRRIAEVPVLAQARVPPTEVVEADSEADRTPPRYAILVSASTQACWLAERTDRSIERAVPLNKEPANLDVTRTTIEVGSRAAADPPKPATIRATAAERHLRVAVRKPRSSAIAIVELPPVTLRAVDSYLAEISEPKQAAAAEAEARRQELLAALREQHRWRKRAAASTGRAC